MRTIKLKPACVFPYKCDIEVIDVTGDEEKRRCVITAEFAKSEILELQTEGFDLASCIEHYRVRIRDLIEAHIGSNWQSTDDMKEILGIIEEKIKGYF